MSHSGSKFSTLLNSSILANPKFYENCLQDGIEPAFYNSTCVLSLLLKEYWESKLKNCSVEVSQIVHTKNYSTSCRKTEAAMFKLAFPFFLVLCIVGNMISIKIFQLPYFKGAVGVPFLIVKACANLGFVCFLSLEMIHSWEAETLEPNPSLEGAYWVSKPYFLWIINWFGTIATWQTVFITIGTLVCIQSPVNYLELISPRRVRVSILLSIALALILHATLPLVWEVQKNDSTIRYVQRDGCSKKIQFYNMKLRSQWYFLVIERTYFFVFSGTVLIIPILIMLISTALICVKVKSTNLGNQFSTRRKCVLWITFTTTLCHLVFEGPAVIIFAAAAFRGSSASHHENVYCFLHILTNFLSVVNATIPFFVFLVWNRQFRRMVWILIGRIFNSGMPSGDVFYESVRFSTTAVTRPANDTRFTCSTELKLLKRASEPVLSRPDMDQISVIQ